MKIVKAAFEILAISPENPLKLLELAGRTCYKSEDKVGPGTDETFCRSILSKQHESVIEHASMSVRFICDRGVSHELVRHRLASFSQESTRYCNYSKDKFGNEITVISPCFWPEEPHRYEKWLEACEVAERTYFDLLDDGATPQEARSVLPNSLKTEIVVTANLREWRHIFKMRCSVKAHPQMREVMIPLLREVRTRIPVLFDDVGDIR